MRAAGTVLVLAGVTLARVIGAQRLSSASGASLSVSAPTEAQYDAGGPSGSTQAYTITTRCTGSGSAGCRLFIQYGSNPQGQQVSMQWALAARSSASQCNNAVANAGAWFDVVPTTVALATDRNENCTATFIFRVNPLAYATYQSPGPVAGAYKQRLNFLLTRP
jgi:hypothetical protein